MGGGVICVLQYLPNDVLLEIGDHLTCTKDISALARVNKQFYQLFEQNIYKLDIQLSSGSPWAFTRGVAFGDYGQIARSIRAGANVNAPYMSAKASDGYQANMLYYSVLHKLNSMTAYLVSLGAHVDTTMTCGSPLFLVLAESDLEMLKFLVEIGRADLNVRNKNGNGLITTAAQTGSLAVLKYLLPLVEDPNDSAPNSSSALHFAISNGKGNFEMLAALLGHSRISPNGRDAQGRTPLFLACQVGSFECAELLLSHKETDTNQADNSGKHPVLVAMEKPYVGMAMRLLSKTALRTNLRPLYDKACSIRNTALAWSILDKAALDKEQARQWRDLAIANDMPAVVKLVTDKYKLGV